MKTNIFATYQLGGNVENTMTLNSRSVVAGTPSDYIKANAPQLVDLAAPEV